jgi:hypothetical protein
MLGVCLLSLGDYEPQELSAIVPDVFQVSRSTGFSFGMTRASWNGLDEADPLPAESSRTSVRLAARDEYRIAEALHWHCPLRGLPARTASLISNHASNVA